MTRRAVLLACVLLLSPVLPLAAQSQAPAPAKAADLTGNWYGTFIISVNGEQVDEDEAYMTLTQKGAELTGTAGPNENQQWPLQNGKVDGAKVTFDVMADGPTLKFVLTLVDGRLKGDASASMDGQSMTAKVDIGRR